MVSNIWTAAADNHLESVQRFINSGDFTANSKDPNGYTPIHAAASYGHLDLIEYLVSQKGGDINIQDNEGDTPLHHVEDLTTAKALIEQYHADYKIKNNDGLTASEFIEQEDEFPQVAKYLKSLTHDRVEENDIKAGNASRFLESLPRPGTIDGHEIKYTLENDREGAAEEELSSEELEKRRRKIESILNSDNPELGLRELVKNAVHEGMLQYNEMEQQKRSNTEHISVPNKASDLTLEELKAMSIWQRAAIRDWRLEFFTIGFILLFVLLYKAGDLYNKSKVISFLKAIEPTFKKQFFQFGVLPNRLYVKDSSENYASYATGRLNIAKVDLKFTLAPRQNVFLWIMEYCFSIFTSSVRSPVDKVDIIITPSGKYDNFISSIVSKLGMDEARKLNYFLSLCKTTDSQVLPQSFVYMSEANEFQEKITTNDLKQALTLQSASYVKFIAFTDQPTIKPENLREFIPNRRVVIELKLTNNKEALKVISNVLEAVFNIVDKLSDQSITFRPETIRKIVKTREFEIEKLKKIEQEAKDEKLAEEQAKLKREERDKLRNMSREDQLKAEKRAQERKQKKMQRKQKVRM
ncbi:hypothetical protein KGF56_003779 [Candida oxycetoniae]|uniref:Ankyrin repeat-containing protein n=1 Tax=Candida oxycetoniae TaxID=497107 RepID=A0AAI9SVX0_9ASCO|nr:uncharacterized protein KGF56_003779 [Candida oxycetoniae]KAI3403495.2 hypothetical protein KGF56_003779 [Candida oxycetoniae]